MKPLLHLSFNANLEGILKPRQPHGSGLDESGKFKKDLPARVSFSPDIQGCFLQYTPTSLGSSKRRIMVKDSLLFIFTFTQ